MQHQSNIPAQLPLDSHVGFAYNSANRSFTCLEQVFSNVAIFEIELYREIAIRNHNNNHRTRDSNAIAAKKRAEPVKRTPPQKAAQPPKTKPATPATKTSKQPARKPNKAKSGPRKSV